VHRCFQAAHDGRNGGDSGADLDQLGSLRLGDRFGPCSDAALGYYINPLFSVTRLPLLLGEIRGRSTTIALAAVAVVLAVAASTYSGTGVDFSWVLCLFQKSLPVGPARGASFSVLLLGPLALAIIVWASMNGAHFATGVGKDIDGCY
jgi:chloramphenicol-sensitive protein RarD